MYAGKLQRLPSFANFKQIYNITRKNLIPSKRSKAHDLNFCINCTVNLLAGKNTPNLIPLLRYDSDSNGRFTSSHERKDPYLSHGLG